MNSDKKIVFLDSSVFIGVLFPKDTHHVTAIQELKERLKLNYQFVTSSIVVDETATVLSNKVGQQQAFHFLDFVKGIKQYFFSEELRRETHALFKKQHKKGTSMVDCSIIVMMKKMKIREIMTFDTWLEKQVTS